jgi:UDP-glucose 4-epimerase
MACFLVTGGSGFIGSHLCYKLVEEGHKVRVLDSMISGKRENLAELGAEIEWFEGDVCDIEMLDRCLEGVEYVLHHAAVASVQTSVERPLFEQGVNMVGTLRLLESARRAGVRRVVFAASAAAYGNDPRLPKREDMLPTPESPYAISKLAGEHYCRVYSTIHGLETVCLRYFNVFGPRQDPASPYSGVISIFAERMRTGRAPIIFGDGKQTRDFVYVQDVAAANMLACRVESARGQVYNIGGGHSVDLRQLVQGLNEALGTQIEPEFAAARPGDVRASLADISRARAELGYEPETDLRKGLRQVVTWMQTSAGQ